jgi:formate hydrogenlyase subunit 4
MNYIPFILFVVAVIFVIYTQNQSNKDLKSIGAIIGGIGMIIVLAMMIFDFGSSGVKKGSKYLDNRNNKKERCVEKSESASNSFTAKKIYKACMSK